MAEGIGNANDWGDLQEQQTEIEALQGIYDHEMTIIKKDTEYKIMIRVDSPPAHVILNVIKPTAATTQQYSSLVDHLPPVVLFIRYPTNYPSSVPPDFNLTSRWLDSMYLDIIAVKLHEIFVPGCIVVYDWVCFIQENLVEIYSSSQQKSSPASLSKVSPVEDQPQGPDVTEKHPLQIFVRSSSIMTDVEEYNDYENHTEFLQNKHNCPLCLCEQLGTEFPEVKLDCGHLFCTECILSHIKVQLQHGGVGKIGCPEFNCDKNISDHVIRCLLSEDDIARYERLLDEYNLDVIPGMVFCPRPKCNTRIASDPQDQLAMCSSCQYPFCKLCRQLWHGDTTVCPATVQLHDNVNTDPEITTQNVKEKDSKSYISLEKQHDLMAIAWVRSNDVRNCPSYGWVIQKFGGCNKMTCLKCRKFFCWLCGKPVAGYSHFHKGGCVLFTDEDYLPPKEAEDVTLPMVDLQELLEPACPRCDDRQEKKTDNNLITCKKCCFKFCYRCKEACYGQWHFSSEYGCPAYSKIPQDITYFRSLTSTENTTTEENTESQ